MNYEMPLKEPVKKKKRTSLYITESQKWKRTAKSLSKETIAENFPKLGRDLDIEFHEDNESLQVFNPK